MKLQKESMFNPYYIVIKDKAYYLDNIYVFDETGVLARNSNGWFGSNNRNPDYEVDVECVRKTKIDFNCKTAFVVKDADDDWLYKSRYALYLPNSVVKLGEAKYRRQNFNSVIKSVKSTVYDIMEFDTWYHFDGKAVDIRENYCQICEDIINCFSSDEKKLPEMADNLRAAIDAYLAEKERLNNMTLEEAIAIINNKKED